MRAVFGPSFVVLPRFSFDAAGATEFTNALSASTSAQGGDPLAVWKWANFVLLAAGLGYLIAKTVPPMFRDRTSEIQKGIAEAAQVKADADKRAAAVDARLAALDSEIKAIREHSQTEMQQEYNAKWTTEQKTRPVKADIVFKAPPGYNDHLDHFTNFFDSVRTGKPVVEDATFGFRAAAPALSCNESYFQKKIIHWDPVNMKLV